MTPNPYRVPSYEKLENVVEEMEKRKIGCTIVQGIRLVVAYVLEGNHIMKKLCEDLGFKFAHGPDGLVAFKKLR